MMFLFVITVVVGYDQPMVYIGLYWFILVYIGLYWFILVYIGLNIIV